MADPNEVRLAVMGIGDRIREIRLAKDMTQLQVGKKMGITGKRRAISWVSYLETQPGNVKAETLIKLSLALGVSADSLLGLRNGTLQPR